MKRWLPAAFALLLGFLAGEFWRKPVRIIEQTATPEPDRPPAPAPPPSSAAPLPFPAPVSPQPPKVSADDPVTRQELVKLLNEKNERLAASEKTLADLEEKLHGMSVKVAELTEQAEKLSASEKELLQRLDVAARLTESLQTELRSRDTRLAQVEVANRELRKNADEAARQTTRFGQQVREIEELSRNREAYITSILRRYREVTDLYRQLTLRQDSPRENDISRIQNAITLADEDLRQLHALNAQYARLAKQAQSSPSR